MLTRACVAFITVVVLAEVRKRAVQRAYRLGSVTGCEKTAGLWATLDGLRDELAGLPGTSTFYDDQLRAAQEGRQ